MKKLALILAFILIAQPGYKIISVFAEGAETETTSVSPAPQDKDSLEIKELIEAYLQCINQQNVDCAMSHIAKEFSGTIENETLDYDGLKLFYERLFKGTANLSISNINISELNIADNKATAMVEYNMQVFNLDRTTNLSKLKKLRDSLIKEGDTWKITSIVSENVTIKSQS